MELESPSQYSQVSATCPYPEPTPSNPHDRPTTSWRSILILSSHLCLGLPNGLFPSGFPTNTLCTTLSSPIRATCPAHLILLDFTTCTILGKEYRSFSSSSHNHTSHKYSDTTMLPDFHYSLIMNMLIWFKTDEIMTLNFQMAKLHITNIAVTNKIRARTMEAKQTSIICTTQKDWRTQGQILSTVTYTPENVKQTIAVTLTLWQMRTTYTDCKLLVVAVSAVYLT
jgi:hypothetical protein